ncbi:MAG: hypothetical protein ABIR06_09280 [Cyclobacteriaceae bacterium]
MNIKLIFGFCTCLVWVACNNEVNEKNDGLNNPPASGFDLANSDPAAVELADSIMAAMGGRKSWDNTRFISWNFFGRRDLVWDKTEGRVRIESKQDSITYLLNLNSMEGRVQIKGQELTEPDSLQKMLKKAKSMWINDSYWLVMPFKLKESGVTLKYLGEDTIANGVKCNMLEMTFNNVGDTPENKYKIYVDLKDNLVKQWAYYKDAAQDSASQVWPFDNYKKHGDILLSADRSDKKGPANVRVDEKLPDAIFTEF